jgi:membrane protein implicated in regulation of membrane protease activity
MLIYAAIGAVGFVLLVGMLVLGEAGGGDHDGGGGDHDLGGHEVGPGLFSVRIMAAFLTAFGVGGLVARYLGWSHPAASGVGVASGVVMAGLVYQFARILFTQQASSEVQMARLVGRTAEVSVAIPAGGVGQVMLTVGGERTEHLARAAGGQGIARGVEVHISGLRGDGLVVTPAAEHVQGGR